MEPLLLFPDPPQPELAQALDLGGYPWKAVANADAAARMEPDDGWAGGLIVAFGAFLGALPLQRKRRATAVTREREVVAA